MYEAIAANKIDHTYNPAMGESVNNLTSFLDVQCENIDSQFPNPSHGLNQYKEKALLELMEKTGYSIIQENGQRKYGGPPPGWIGSPPPKGSEIFVGKIPRDLFEDELVPVFETVGRIYEMRLMMDFSGSNRGYAFVMYADPPTAMAAVRKFNNFEIRKGRYLGVVKSVDNCRLFVGGIPKTKGREEILEEMQKVTEGVKDVILYSSVSDKSKSRGFAFIEYENHRAAAMARRKLVPGRRILLWGHEIAVDWAEPEPEVDEDTMSKVTILYVRNLMMATTEDKIRDVFNKITINGVEKVKKIRDFAFVHFTTRQKAEIALHAFHNEKLDGAEIEVTWAKPADRGNNPRTLKHLCKSLVPGGYGTLGCGQQGLYDNSLTSNYNMPSIMQPFVKHRSRGAGGIRGNRAISSSGFMKVPFSKTFSEIRHFNNLQSCMEFIPTNPVALKPFKTTIQQLHELCIKNGWSEPKYFMFSCSSEEGSCNNMMKYRVTKVTIDGIPPPYDVFYINDCQVGSSEEAKCHAAEIVLGQLGVVPEGANLLSCQLSNLSISNSAMSPVMMAAASYSPQYVMNKLPSYGGLPSLVSGVIFY